MDKVVIAIDASRNRSGGARAHILGVVNSLCSEDVEGVEIHVWSYRALLDELQDESWLVKHSPDALSKSIFSQLWWQYVCFPKELKSIGCNVVLNTGASTLSNFRPSITMSRDMLSFEEGEMQRYPFFSRERLRLLVIKYLQIFALHRSDGVIFLTDYAMSGISKFVPDIKDFRVIPHGISDDFRGRARPGYFSGARDSINCLYVSNVDLYKHQWHVVEAVSILRKSGYPVRLILVGSVSGRGAERLREAIGRVDPFLNFIDLVDSVPHAEIPKFLSQSDIFVFASSCENMPNTLVEGMASGLPVACSMRGPMPEVLGKGGVYFDPESPEQIASALRALIVDSDLRSKVSEVSSFLSAKYSWRRCAIETLSYLKYIARKFNR